MVQTQSIELVCLYLIPMVDAWLNLSIVFWAFSERLWPGRLYLQSRLQVHLVHACKLVPSAIGTGYKQVQERAHHPRFFLNECILAWQPGKSWGAWTCHHQYCNRFRKVLASPFWTGRKYYFMESSFYFRSVNPITKNNK